MGVVVDYAVVDAAMAEISGMMNDEYIQILAGRLGSEIEYSQSDYVNVLLEAAAEIKEINQIVNGLMLDAKEMLRLAKHIYADGDVQMSNLIDSREEQHG